MKIEYEILDFIQNNFACSFLDKVMPVITFLGNSGAIWIVTAVILLFFKKYRITAVQILTGLLLGLLIGNIILKNIVARERPCWVNEDIHLLIAVPHDYSFPSGHTLASFVSAGVIFMNNKKVGILAYILASLIAFSRLYLYVHFPTDIIGGVLIGTAIAIITVFFTKKYLKNF